MRVFKKKTGWIFRFLPLFVIMILLCLSIAPSDRVNTQRYKTVSRILAADVKSHIPVSQVERTYFLTGYYGSEILNDIEVNLTITRSFRDFKSMVIRFFNILLPIVGFGLFIYCLGYFIRRKKQNISVMAMSMGGHAPPKYNYLR